MATFAPENQRFNFYISMKKIKLLVHAVTAFLLLAPSGCMCAQAVGVERPKLVVGIVVDQMRWDYLYRYYSLFGEGGFKRLMNEGFSCENTMINYVPSVTAVGHTSIYTGSVPAVHGIAGNSFLLNDKMTYCCADSTVRSVGSSSDEGMMSPRNLLATTIGDELKIATDFKSKVVGVSLKDRASILPAGRAANGAYWMDYTTGTFISSTYYMDKLPQWVTDYNKTIGKVTKDEICYTPLGNKLTEELAKAAVAGESLGGDSITDLLTVSFSCTDLVGHKYGTHSDITRGIYVDLDRRLADLFQYLDQTVGKGQYLTFLTADHGAANNILMLDAHGISGEGFFVNKVEKDLNNYLMNKFGSKTDLVRCIDSYKVFINHDAANRLSAGLDGVKEAAVEWLKENPLFAYVVDLEHANDAVIPAVIREKIINGYNRRRSGDIQLVLRPACYEVTGDQVDGGTTHGEWNPYDAHIPFLLMGWHVVPGKTHEKVSITDIAPTVCAMISIQMPNGCIGNPVTSVIDH